MNSEEIANEITRRIQLQLGVMMIENVRLQVEKELAEKALAEAQQKVAVSE